MHTDHTFLVQFTVKRNALVQNGVERGFVWIKVGCVSKGRSENYGQSESVDESECECENVYKWKGDEEKGV